MVSWHGKMDVVGEQFVLLKLVRKKESMPDVVRMLPPQPAHIHSPIVGIESHPIYTADIMAHYECPEKDGAWVAQQRELRFASPFL